MRVYRRGDINKAPIFRSLNPEILSMQLDMKTEKGVECLRDLVAKSDIVLENLKAGALDRAGMGFEGMKKVKKDIILVSLKMYGSTGPLAEQVGYAPCFAALGGLNSLVGYEGEPPRGVNQSYGDSTAGASMAFGALAALLHRERTGEGQYVDLSATEAMSSMIGDLLVEYGLTGKIPRHEGNRHSELAPHGVYPCVGGEWISIAVGSDVEWVNLCEALGATDLKSDARFSSMAARQGNLNALDETLSALTAKHHAAVLAARLRQCGVPATKCQSSLDMIGDQHLWQRRTYQNVHESSGEARTIVGSPWHFSRAPFNIARGAPLLGEHNAYVYRDLLGRSQQEFEDLIKEGVVN
jgi:crotonobetainyl-CoA:carnitine CoA-transferase CaiB-like acyl-CoA transferase